MIMRLSLLVLALIFFYSCNQKSFDTKEKLLSYIKNPENGYFQERNINGINISVLYRPTDLLVIQELDSNFTEKTLDSLRNKYSGYLYFNLSYSKKGQEILSQIPTSRREYSKLNDQFAFRMGEKVHLYTNRKDTIELLNYTYPPKYGMDKATTLILVYPKSKLIKASDNFYITIEDIGLTTGEVKFKYSSEKLTKEPKIKL